MASNTSLVACWLDPDIGEAGKHLPLKKRFEGVSNRIAQWYYFDSGDQFNEFIDGNPNAKLVAIMSAGFAKRVVNPISDRDVLHSVYVFCGNLEKNKNLPLQEPKIKGVFITEDDLFRQMKSDLQREFPQN
jgi:hypothetical protein